MTVFAIKTSSWFTPLPLDHCRIGISRGTPRRMAAGYRLYRKLAPGPWFNSVGLEEYERRYQAEILAPLDLHQVAAELADMAEGRVAVMLCYEKPGEFCHRSLAARFLAEGLGIPVPEFGYEGRTQDRHPLGIDQATKRQSAFDLPTTEGTSWTSGATTRT